jgi:multidrug efflux pump subunit AcrB
MEGRPGACFEPLALAYGVAVVAATEVAITVAPALGALVVPHGPTGWRVSPLVLCATAARSRASCAVRGSRSPRAARDDTAGAIEAVVRRVPVVEREVESDSALGSGTSAGCTRTSSAR